MLSIRCPVTVTFAQATKRLTLISVDFGYKIVGKVSEQRSAECAFLYRNIVTQYTADIF